MKTFRDSTNREWSISLTLGSARRIKDKLGVDLLQPEQGDPPLMTRMGTDETLLAEIILVLMESQFAEYKMTEEAVLESFDGTAILAAQTALYEELSDFFQSRGRADRAAAMKKQMTTLQLAATMGSEKILSLQDEDVIRGAMSGSSPESSESIPAR